MQRIRLAAHYLTCAFISAFFLAGTALLTLFLAWSAAETFRAETLTAFAQDGFASLFFLLLVLTGLVATVLPWTEPVPQTTRPA